MQFERIDQRTDSSVNDCSRRKGAGVPEMQVSRIFRATLNELVEHAPTGDRTVGGEVVPGAFPDAPAPARPPMPRSSTQTTSRCVWRNRPQPATG